MEQFREEFKQTLDPDWTWVHEEPTAWKIEENALHLRTLPGTLWGEANNAHNFLLRPAENLTAGFAAQVRVTNAPQLMGEQAGLILYIDDDNYIKLVKESLEGEEWIVLAREEKGKSELVHKVGITGEAAEIRFVFTSDKAQGQFRMSAADEWTTVGECAFVGDVVPSIGLFTHGGPGDLERWATFQRFVITAS